MLLSGGGATAMAWWSVASRLSATRRVYTVEMSEDFTVTRPARTPRDLADWFGDTLDGLDLAAWRITGFGSDSRYSRTARACSSSGYSFGAATNTPPHGHQTMIKKLYGSGGSSCVAVSRGRCEDLKLAVKVQDGLGEYLVGAVGKTRQPTRSSSLSGAAPHVWRCRRRPRSLVRALSVR
jgi:hypothetical protein